jgi:hypothetical protein
MTKEKLLSEIEFKKRCIFYTERLIKDPPDDFVSQIMIEQAKRLKAQLAEFEAELAKFKKEDNKKPKKKQILRKQNKNKRRKK